LLDEDVVDVHFEELHGDELVAHGSVLLSGGCGVCDVPMDSALACHALCLCMAILGDDEVPAFSAQAVASVTVPPLTARGAGSAATAFQATDRLVAHWTPPFVALAMAARSLRW